MTNHSSPMHSQKMKAAQLLRQNRLAEAKLICEEIASKNNTDVENQVTLAIILRRIGDLPQATLHCRKALRLDAENAQAHLELGTILQHGGTPLEAVASYREATRLKPDLPDAHYRLANVLGETGKLEASATAFRRLLDLDPTHIQGMNNLSVVLRRLGDFQGALTVIRKAIAQYPDTVQLYTNLGATCLQMGLFEEALESLEKAVALKPDYYDAHQELSNVQLTAGRFQEALRSCENALRIRPDAREVLVRQAHTLEVLGETDKAYSLLQPLLQAGAPGALPVFFDLSKKLGKRDSAVTQLQNALKDSSLPNSTRSSIHFRLGKHYDETSDFDQAFAHYREANRLSDKSFDIAPTKHLFNAIITTYTQEYCETLAQSTNQSRQPIFILGMPRTGTTLVEQILASHKDVYGAGELPHIQNIAARLASRHRQGGYPAFAQKTHTEELNEAARKHLTQLDELSGSAKYVTDKMPHNFVYLGLIVQLFPNARIIHCVRDPLDTCLSNFFASFGSTLHNYNADLTHLGHYYRQYQKLMAHWESVFATKITRVNYENIVTQQESETRSLLDFCGLEWDQNCLHFEKSARIPYTVSYDQINRPIHTNSIKRWKNYEHHLDELQGALGNSS